MNYLQDEWGDKAAVDFAQKVFDFLDILVKFPNLGTVEHVKKNIRGFPIVKQVTLFYKLKGEQVILLNFFDNRQNPKKKQS